jgi:hypothetical protein
MVEYSYNPATDAISKCRVKPQNVIAFSICPDDTIQEQLQINIIYVAWKAVRHHIRATTLVDLYILQWVRPSEIARQRETVP